MTDTVRWGVLGAAKFAEGHMAPAINAAKGAALAGLATSSPEKAGPFQAIAPGLTVYDSYDALLADPKIDAVYVPLPNHLHVEWTLKALAAGKPVLTEKPIAMQAGEIDQLIVARDDTGLLAAEAYMIVHHPQWQRARELVQGGAIGDLVFVDSVFSYDNSSDPGNIRNRPETGGGSLPDIGVYTFGAARWVTGEEPQRLEAHIRRENGVDVFSHVTGDFPSFRYSSVTSMRAHPRQYVTFQGREGVITLTAPFNAGVFGQAELALHRNAHGGGAPSVTVERWPSVNQYVNQVETFGRSIQEGMPYPWRLEDAKGTQAMIDMAFAAERGN
ncbi:Gfo/Idh/MocA family protein [Ovoidimarina sediminis]|uniref:Gfo/Idh/MocA family protein n=1 Tax=Ovoidimarina sediminis TaxID=3079856 RepID=UPI002915B61D|nr:Gfo/Idh/MocA family oxidoreductase [Rhodophyticola sp. MJ-SS7]MDU8945411.1 Gfo/Idh/MocA family oxidoreductase [Rhodophyticola sp. MJ-SS7]